MWNADINVKTFEMKIGGDWSLQKSFDIWAGVHDNCIWTGNEDTNTCRVLGCTDDIVDAASSVVDIAEAAIAAATEIVDQWADNHGIPSWVMYAFIVLVAIAIVLGLFILGSATFTLPVIAAI